VIVLILLAVNGSADEEIDSNDDKNIADSVVVPDVVGEYFEDAIPIAKDAGMFLVITGKENNESVERHCILTQKPKPKTKAPKDSALLGVVSSGKITLAEPGTVSDLLFLSEKDAVEKLCDIGIPYTLNYIESDHILDGLVAGQELKGDTGVVIDISIGSEAQDAALREGGFEEIIEQVKENRDIGERLDIRKVYEAYKAVLENDVENILFLQDRSRGKQETFNIYKMEKSIAFADIDGDGIPEMVYSSYDTDSSGDDFMPIDTETEVRYEFIPKIRVYRYLDGAVKKVYDEYSPWFRLDYASSGCVFINNEGLCIVSIEDWGGDMYKVFSLNAEGMQPLTYLHKCIFHGDESFKCYSAPDEPPVWKSPDGGEDYKAWEEMYTITGEEFRAKAKNINGSIKELLLLDDFAKDSVGRAGEFFGMAPADYSETGMSDIVNMQPIAMSYSEAIAWLNERIV